jgi:hypothetical protein
MITEPAETRRFLASAGKGESNEKNRTWWDFELRRELNRLLDLFYVIRCHIVQEALKMKDENGWQRLEKHLLARLAQAGSANLHWVGLRDVCKCGMNSAYWIRLRKEFKN